ncbi:hypothetical protein FisN_2Hh332 [Fistulifera solaris]|uniref:Uncharacterized protein n=1 Tax=Fistulifera solaris TaxID=1519565 RepID=A0A1Z5KL18_FISSO|nr:hypothetical protein FisN_2Hh332 [Fistulifera solaris]|eukprot:GAX26721.1 hypothetical protein FisN_2Hh332 [Fistulifera solaris]
MTRQQIIRRPFVVIPFLVLFLNQLPNRWWYAFALAPKEHVFRYRTFPDDRRASVRLGTSNNQQDEGPTRRGDLVKTLNGGTAMIFEMARRSFSSDPSSDSTFLPRWHPVRGISPYNPNFRTQPPPMDPQGYAGTIWKNARKSAQPAMWRYALRSYDRMMMPSNTTSSSTGRVERTNIHYEGALVACSKLGEWEKALEIYNEVQRKEKKWLDRMSAESASQSRRSRRKYEPTVFITDTMIMSLMRACVRAARDKKHLSIVSRREPLDVAVQAVKQLPDRIPLVSRHLNPIAAVYQSLGLYQEAALLLSDNLTERSRGPEPENGEDQFNVHDVGAKDKASSVREENKTALDKITKEKEGGVLGG